MLAEGQLEVSAAVLVSPVVQLRRAVEAVGRRYGVSYAWSDEAIDGGRVRGLRRGFDSGLLREGVLHPRDADQLGTLQRCRELSSGLANAGVVLLTDHEQDRRAAPSEFARASHEVEALGDGVRLAVQWFQ